MRIWSAVAIGGVMALGAACGAGEPALVIVFDNAGISTSAIEEAVSTAHGVFRRAGIDMAWNICLLSVAGKAGCHLPSPDEYLRVSVVPRRKGPPATGEAMGAALTTDGAGTVSYLFAEPADEFAIRVHQRLGVVLGCVMAHEVGHLLGLRHSFNGIMKPVFTENDMVAASLGRFNLTIQEARARRVNPIR